MPLKFHLDSWLSRSLSNIRFVLFVDGKWNEAADGALWDIYVFFFFNSLETQRDNAEREVKNQKNTNVVDTKRFPSRKRVKTSTPTVYKIEQD